MVTEAGCKPVAARPWEFDSLTLHPYHRGVTNSISGFEPEGEGLNPSGGAKSVAIRALSGLELSGRSHRRLPSDEDHQTRVDGLATVISAQAARV